MRIGVLTFHAAFNYGSMLQAWALQQVLTEMGHKVEIVNFQSIRQKYMYRRPFSNLSIPKVLSDIKNLLIYGERYLYKYHRWSKFDEFLKRNLIITSEFNEVQLSQIDLDYDCIVVGSDQIWNINAYDFSPIFFGEGINKKIRLIAYGTSMGPCPDKFDKSLLKEKLSRFDIISVREYQSKCYLENNGIVERVNVVLDPTMLLNFTKYAKFIHPIKNPTHRYAYYYTPGNHPDILQIAEHICNELNIFIAIDTGYINGKMPVTHNGAVISLAGPEEFLNYVYNSEFVLGASFHLIVFAILMHKEFFCINGNKDNRLNNLLSTLGLQDRIVDINDISTILNQIKPINWSKVDELLEIERNKSIDFLRYI